jgi:hypothetical protein
MNCGSFRENHGAFIDDALDELERVAMHGHRAECPACAAHDTAVRRALLLFRNMPTIEPSPDFSRRLQARLRADKASRTSRIGEFGAVASAVAGIVAAGYLTVAVFGTHSRLTAELALSPVVAEAAEPTPPPINIYAPQSPAIVASVSAGLPVWPAAMLAAQAPMHIAVASMTDAPPAR